VAGMGCEPQPERMLSAAGFIADQINFDLFLL
jgi:hypothetical protein